ncbi:MAG: hypothetical protein HS107_10055 [Thermoflexaceae bacterium]|nr:hypothetical protein [Thermoflexaceae bacterium]
MDIVLKAYDRLMQLEWSELQELMVECGQAHAAMCATAGEDVDPHADRESMRARVAAMSKETLAGALAPFAALGEVAHEHHPEHGTH